MGFLSIFWKFVVGGGWKWLVGGAVALAISTAARTAYKDYRHKVETIITLTENNAKLSAAAQVNEKTIEEMIFQAERNAARTKELSNNLINAETEVNDLQQLLSRHNLEFLALQKPGLIERRINDATNNVFRDIECTTDSLCHRAP
jgi:Holliday junction resolvasome RuvABC DNA-binding subunit